MKWLLLLCPVMALAATPPQLPAPTIELKFRDQPYRVGLLLTNRPHCTTNCPLAITNKLLVWDHYGPGSQFIRFDIEAKHKITDTSFFVLATVTQTQYRVWFTNGNELYIKIAAWDSALKKKAGGWQ